jgi:flagellar secretion chaperone FliS
MPAVAHYRASACSSVLLMDGALERIAQARESMGREELLTDRSGLLHTATSIIGELRGELDLRRGGPMAANFDDLYDYLGRRLRAAQVQSDPEILDEVWHLLWEVRSAWALLPPYARGQAPAIKE